MKKKTIMGLAVLGIAALVSIASLIFSARKEQTSIVPIHHQETIGDLAYEIKLDKTTFDSKDDIVVHAKVTNIGKETIPYVSGSSTCPTHVSIAIIQQESKEELAIKPNDRPCTADWGTSKLVPGQTVEDSGIFISKTWVNSELEPALPGTYEVKVSLPNHTELPGSEPKEPRAVAKTQINLQ